jgi:hypothetical protein
MQTWRRIPTELHLAVIKGEYTKIYGNVNAILECPLMQSRGEQRVRVVLNQ